MLKRILREPLLHFAVMALTIFAAYAVLAPSGGGAPDKIVVSGPKIEQIAAIFAKTWQRPPTAPELKGLIDDYVKEEIYYREAKKLGLDTDDTVIRRRLRLKMEFMNDAAAGTLMPSDAELEAYLKANPATFEIDPMLAFQQVYLNPQRRGDKIEQDAASILEVLRASPGTDPASLGDTTLLPPDLPLTSKTAIGQNFGFDFADALDKEKSGTWTGPIASSFGLHIIRISERKPGRAPALAEVRDAVLREWTNQKRRDFETARFDELLKRYEVTIDTQSASGAAP